MKKHEAEILRAMDKVNEGGSTEDIDTIVTDYFYLVKKIAGKKKPSKVSIRSCSNVILDGESYFLYEEIRHNDARNTERYMEIEALFTDNIPTEEVERRLEEKIRNEW